MEPSAESVQQAMAQVNPVGVELKSAKRTLGGVHERDGTIDNSQQNLKLVAALKSLGVFFLLLLLRLALAPAPAPAPAATAAADAFLLFFYNFLGFPVEMFMDNVKFFFIFLFCGVGKDNAAMCPARCGGAAMCPALCCATGQRATAADLQIGTSRFANRHPPIRSRFAKQQYAIVNTPELQR